MGEILGHLAKISIFLQSSVVFIISLFFLAEWYILKSPIVKTWAKGWLLDVLALLSVLYTTFFPVYSSIRIPLFISYAFFKFSFIFCLILGTYKMFGLAVFEKVRRVLLVVGAVLLLGEAILAFKFSPVFLQGSVVSSTGILSLWAGVDILRRKNTNTFPTGLLSLGFIIYGLVFLQHGLGFLPYLWGNGVPSNLERVSFFDALVELLLGIFLFLSNQISTIRKLKAMNLALEESRRRLRRMVEIDPLTGLYNRRKLREYVHRVKEGMVAFIDIDGFKAINDRWGHDIGDEYLRKVADYLRDSFREEGIFRIGGDEFLVIISGLDENKLRERIRVLKESLKKEKGLPESLSISVGLSSFKEEAEFSAALHLADRNMYLEKISKKSST